jgi:HlyD family secretion protein
MTPMAKKLLTLAGTTSLLAIAGVAVWPMLWPKTAFETTGLIQAEEIKLASTQPGRLSQLLVTEGQAVKAGQPLVVLQDNALATQAASTRNALTQAQLALVQLRQGANPRDVQQAQARVWQARQQLQLLTDGSAPDVVSQAKAHEAELNAQLAAAQAELHQAQAQVQAGVLAPAKLASLQGQVTSLQKGLNAAHTTLRVAKAGPRPEQKAIAGADLAAAQAQLAKLQDGARRTDVQIAQANIEKAAIAAKAANQALADLTITTPSDGVVGVVSLHPGELVQPGKPVVTLVNLNKAWVEIYIPEKLLPKLTVGQAIPLTSDTFPGKTFPSKISFISPQSEFIPAAGSSGEAQESATFRVKLQLEPATLQTLRPGMKVHAVIP